MVEAVLSTANDAFQHADLAGAASTEQLGAMRDLFEQMGVAHDMERQQVQSLLIEPLQAMVDDPKGLASGSRLFSTFTSLSHDFYEALSEFLSLEGEGANATAARAHAKTQAKAAAKMGSAVMSQAASKMGTGFGFLSRKLNQQLGVDLGLGAPDAPDTPPSTAAAAEEEDGGGGGGPSVGDMAREAYSGIKQAGSHAHAVHDTEARVLKQQEALLKTRHAMEVRLGFGFGLGLGLRFGLGLGLGLRALAGTRARARTRTRTLAMEARLLTLTLTLTLTLPHPHPYLTLTLTRTRTPTPSLTLEVRLLESSGRARLQLARSLVDLFYAQYSG